MTLSAARVPAPRASEPARVPAPSTPLLTLNLATVAASYAELVRVLPAVGLHYPVRTNPSPLVLRTLARAGARWQVAGRAELDSVLAVDPDPRRVTYGSTVTKTSDLVHAYACGVRTFTVDCDRELTKVAVHAPGAQVVVRLAAPGRRADATGSTPGCGEVEARRLLLRAVDLGHPVGVGFHVGSQQRDVHAWEEPLAAAARLRDAVRHAGADLVTVDLGGGIPGHSPVPTPPVSAYGTTITAAVRRHLGPHPPRVVAAPGTFLVAEAGSLEAEVVLVTDRGGVRWVHLDAEVAAVVSDAECRTTAYRGDTPLDGPLCGAVLLGPAGAATGTVRARHRTLLPLDLADGDRVVVHAAGACPTQVALPVRAVRDASRTRSARR